MDTKRVKKASEITLDGITAELERTDQAVDGVVLRDAKGGVLLVRYRDYGLQVLVPAPPPMVTRYRIEGEIKKVKFSELFEEEYQAVMRRNELDLTDEECPVVKVEVPE